jgi:poly(hydroxyalkanoate) depolymerase family esterase
MRTLDCFRPKEVLDMNDMLNPDKMVEATHLTRAGRLTEATALLQRMLRGKSGPDVTFGTAGDIVSCKQMPQTIDATVANDKTDHSPSSRFSIDGRPAGLPFASATTTAQPHLFRRLSALFRLKRPGPAVGLHGLERPTPDIVPEGGKFIDAMYSNAAGSRAFKLYIPSRYHGQPLPLVVMLHGCTQSPDDFAAGTRMNLVAEEHTCLVVYPAQPSEANAAKCWNWFRPSDQRRGQGEPSLIAGITRQVMRDYAVDPERVYIGGLSAGAAAAAVMGATYPDLYAAIGVHSGLACGAAKDLPTAFVAMRQGDLPGSSKFGDISEVPRRGQAIPTIVFHGDKDTTVHPRNGEHVIAQSKGATNLLEKVHRGRVPGGHSYTRTIHADASGRESLSTGKSTEPDTLGREAAPLAPTLIRAGRTPRGRCCASSSITPPHGRTVRVFNRCRPLAQIKLLRRLRTEVWRGAPCP